MPSAFSRSSKRSETGEPPPGVLREKAGLFELTETNGNEEDLVDIIAVHGLNGHWEDTWTADNGRLWLRDFLPEQVLARVLSFGYNSTVRFSKSVAGIDDHALALLNALELKRMTEQALILANERREMYNNILEYTRAIAFMGVPHRGSSSAAWGTLLGNILKYASLGTSTNTGIVADLEKDSSTLMAISSQFKDRAKDLTVYSFYETEMMGGMNGLVVDSYSALLHLHNEKQVPVNGTHRTICKFNSAASQAYGAVGPHIVQMIARAKKQVPQGTTHAEAESTCLSKLYQSDPVSAKRAMTARTKGTCEWILKHGLFSQWRQSKASGLLWLSGSAGCGKTVLSSYLIDELTRLSPDSTICYFFCNDLVDQRTASALLRSILWQLLSAKRNLLKHAIAEFMGKDIDKVIEEPGVLWRVCMAGFEDPGAGSIVCVLDALDECEMPGRDLLLKSITSYFNPSNIGESKHVKIFLTSRPVISVLDILDGAAVRLNLDEEHVSIDHDVKLLVMERVAELRSKGRCSQNSARRLQDRLLGNAGRTFLWASLILELLETSFESSEQAFNDVLDNLPDGLYGTYARILAEIPLKERTKSRAMLQLIAFAGRAFTLAELNVAWTIRSFIHSEDAPRSEDHVNSYLDGNISRTVSGLCGSLVSVIEGRLYLVHQTAKAFLTDELEQTSGAGKRESPWYRLQPVQAHLALVQVCVCYLLLPEFNASLPNLMEMIGGKSNANSIVEAVREPRADGERSPAEPLDSSGHSETGSNSYWINHEVQVQRFADVHTLFIYASKSWPVHLDAAENMCKTIPTSIIDKALRLYDTSQGYLQTWMTGHIHGTVFQSSEGRFRSYRLFLDPLLLSSALGHKTLVRYFLHKGADINVGINEWPGTPLHLAVIHQSASLLDLLLEHNANPLVEDGRGFTPLGVAVYKSREQATRTLLHFVTDKTLLNTDIPYSGLPMLHTAVLGGSNQIVGLLLEHGADVAMVGCFNNTALHYAALIGSSKAVSTLLQHGAGTEKIGNAGNTPLLNAIRVNGEIAKQLRLIPRPETAKVPSAIGNITEHEEIIRLLLASGANIEERGSTFRTPLAHAIASRKINTVRILLAGGADIEGRCGIEYTTLVQAVLSGDREIIELLLMEGADIEGESGCGKDLFSRSNAVPSRNEEILQPLPLLRTHENEQSLVVATPFPPAVVPETEEIERLLLAEEADIERSGAVGLSPLYCAVAIGRADIVHLLLANGADVTKKLPNGSSLLLAALLGGNEAIVQDLIDHEADINELSEFELPLVIIAVMQENARLVEILLRAGADANRKGHSGVTALFLAVYKECVTIAELLVNAKANVNEEVRGMLILHVAVDKRNERLVRLLLLAGANPHFHNQNGATAEQYINSNDSAIKQMIQEYKSRIGTP